MAGRGQTPKDDRRPKSKTPQRGTPSSASVSGWQHGEIPEPPDGLVEASREAWATWFNAWFAAHWTPEDLPSMRQLIRIYDQVERGQFQRTAELRLWLDTMGITPKGQQDRRWKPPVEETPRKKAAGAYDHLRVVKD